MSLKPFLQFKKFRINKEQRLGLDFQTIVANSPGIYGCPPCQKVISRFAKSREKIWVIDST